MGSGRVLCRQVRLREARKAAPEKWRSPKRHAVREEMRGGRMVHPRSRYGNTPENGRLATPAARRAYATRRTCVNLLLRAIREKEGMLWYGVRRALWWHVWRGGGRACRRTQCRRDFPATGSEETRVAGQRRCSLARLPYARRHTGAVQQVYVPARAREGVEVACDIEKCADTAKVCGVFGASRRWRARYGNGRRRPGFTAFRASSPAALLPSPER